MYSIAALGIGVVFLVSSLAFLTWDPKQRDILLGRLHIHRGRVKGSFTPPRSLSPEKQGLPPNKQASGPDYSDAFPPSRRHTLADVKLNGPGLSGKELGGQPPVYSKRVPHDKVANTEPLADHVTATGFTVAEIKRLGDFPDYATLSGVPLPNAYKEFDISQALPRPYRPLRWAYHQTMCKWNC